MAAPVEVTTPRMLQQIAAAAVDGRWLRSSLADRLAEILPADTADRVAGVLLDHFSRPPWGPVERVAAEVAAIPALGPALAPVPTEPPVLTEPRVSTGPRVLTGPAGAEPSWRWPVLPWTSVGQVAAGLDLSVGELDWLADPGGWLRRRPHHSDGDGGRWASRLRHYRYRWLSTSSGTGRLLEAPKPLLAERQRRLTRRVLARIPVHDAAHGFVPGRSVTTFATPHAGRDVVVRMDLEGFFTTITAARVRGLLGTVGYPDAVGRVLAGLLTTATPVEVLASAPVGVAHGGRRRAMLATPHLPQGAPSSPSVANLIAYGLDHRLRAWATSRGLTYTRYADDLAFSGPAATDVVALRRTVARIAGDEGFRVQPAKTLIMRSHRQQRLTGLVVNSAPAVPRVEYDRLRAILHHAAATGPAAQNRDGHADFAAHLRGRIAWVAATHPARGRRLLAMYDRVPWDR